MSAMSPDTRPASGARPPVLEIKGLTVRLPEGADREFAIEDVSLSVGSGEIVCVVGESGSGKSVTAFTVMGLNPRKEVRPVAGEILLHGLDILTQSERRLRRLRGDRLEEMRVLEGNADLRRRLASVDLGTIEFTMVDAADGTPLNAYMIKPTDFDEKKGSPH